MLARRHIFARLGHAACLWAALSIGCAPLGVRNVAPHTALTVTPIDPVATTVPPANPAACPPMTPLDRAAAGAAPPAIAQAPAPADVAPLVEAVPAAPLGPEPLALAQAQPQRCLNQGAAAAAQPNPIVPVTPPPVTAPPKKPCGKRDCCPWFSQADPPPNIPRFRPGVTIAPRELIAPVGSEVILTAAVANNAGTLVAGDPVQWTLSQGGVGEFIELGPRDMLFHPPKKIDSHYAIGRTSKSYFRITRGTTEATDDAIVLRGQAWASVTSPQEGVSYVTAYAPDEENWDRRKDTAKIYWVDAQWQFPPPAINPAGQPHVFTTVLTRATDQTPIQGWVVQYRVLDGPSAGFGEGAAPLYTVVTDADGRAPAQLVQRELVEGVNNIEISVIRPANPARGETKPLVLGTGVTTKQWTNARAPLAVRITGPAQAQRGQQISYRIEVTNPGDVEASNVMVRDTLPEQLTFANAVPRPVSQEGSTFVWRLDTIGPGQQRVIDLQVVVGGANTFNNCVQASATNGASAQSCATTTVASSQLEIDIRGPETVRVGDTVTFEITTVNRGTAPATGLVVYNTFDPGFEHVIQGRPGSPSPISRAIRDIAPGTSGDTIGVSFYITRPGQLCQTVELVSADGQRVSDRICVNSIAAAPAPAPAQLTISHTLDRAEARVSGRALSTIVVRNNGQTVAQDVRVVCPSETQYLYAEQTAPPSFTFRDNEVDLTYVQPTLQPGEEITLQVEWSFLRTTGRACVVATVGAQGIQAQSAEACLRVLEEPRLNINIAEIADPIVVGQTTSYVVTVSNSGATSVRDLRLEFALPREMVFQGTGRNSPVPGRDRQGVVVFDPVPELAPNASTRWEVIVRGAQPKRSAIVEASLFVEGGRESTLTASEPTEILSPR